MHCDTGHQAGELSDKMRGSENKHDARETRAVQCGLYWPQIITPPYSQEAASLVLASVTRARSATVAPSTERRQAGELELMSVGHDVTGSDVTPEAGSRRLDRDAAIVVRARAALTSFQYKSSEQLQHTTHITIMLLVHLMSSGNKTRQT